MEILILGNGFDLAHSLPTKYIDFLRFVNELLKIGQSDDADKALLIPPINDADEESKRLAPVKDFILSITKAENATDEEINVLEELISLTKGNIWFRWFNKRVRDLGGNWVDFEAEISDVIRVMEFISEKLDEYKKSRKKSLISFADEFGDFHKMVLEYFFPKVKEINDINIEKIKIIMLSDLNKLVRCFEIYLSECVEHIKPKKLSPDIYGAHFDKVLSFNYTDTYARMYSKSGTPTEYDFLHGKTQSNAGTPNNMVLGIDEYLSKEQQHINTTFIEFKKYFQRIHKRTGCQYKLWFNEINSSKERSRAYIYGHSLAATDKDVLLDFLNNDKIVTIVYYWSDENYANLIVNLVKLLGVDELIAKVHGREPQIVFRQQRSLEDIDNKDLQNSTS